MEDIDSLNIRWGEHIRKNIEEWGEEMQDKFILLKSKVKVVKCFKIFV